MAKQHWEFLASDRWVRVTLGGEIVADSIQARTRRSARGIAAGAIV